MENQFDERMTFRLLFIAKDKKYFSIPVFDLPLNARIKSALSRSKISNLAELIDFELGLQPYSTVNLGDKSQLEIFQLLKKLATANEVNTVLFGPAKREWARASEQFFESLDNRERYILINRFGSNISTLQKISTDLHITRERVRQIEKKISQKYYAELINKNTNDLLNQIAIIILKLGLDFSIGKFECELRRNNLLGEFTHPIICEYCSPPIISEIETLLCWLTIASNKKNNNNNIDMKVLQSLDIKQLKNSKAFSFGSVKLFEVLTPRTKHQLLRKVLFTGGINLRDACKTLQSDEKTAKEVLEMLNFVFICDDWYSLESFDLNWERIPIKNAAYKMLTVIPEIDLEIFSDGIRRYISRHDVSMAPKKVLAFTLQKLGFTVINDHVSSTFQIPDILSKTEKLFVSFIKEKGNVVSFFEIAETFLENGFSLPSVGKLTNASPIVEKTGNNLYKIRGSKVTWNEIEAGINRQQKYSLDEILSYCMDGTIHLQTTINKYAFFTGVLVSTKVKDLNGKWLMIYDQEKLGYAKLDGFYIWGLHDLFSKNNIKTGDRIELFFDTTNRQMGIIK
jgi:hypothetical protein